MDLGIYAPDDFLQRYGDCVVKISTVRGNTYLFQIARVTDIEMRGYALIGETWVPKTFKLKNIEMDSTFPELGAINIPGSVAIISRKVHKQYRQAFNFRNSVIGSTVVEAHLRQGDEPRAFRLKDTATVREIFYPTYTTVHEAIMAINSKVAMARAISSRYYIACSAILPCLYVGYNNFTIGRINETTGECTLFEEAAPLREDLQQYISVCEEEEKLRGI